MFNCQYKRGPKTLVLFIKTFLIKLLLFKNLVYLINQFFTFLHHQLVSKQRTCSRVMPIQLFTIWMIFKQINHVKSVRDVPIFLQREHISFIINLHRQENGYALDVPSPNHLPKILFCVDACPHQPCTQHWQPPSQLTPLHESAVFFCHIIH